MGWLGDLWGATWDVTKATAKTAYTAADVAVFGGWLPGAATPIFGSAPVLALGAAGGYVLSADDAAWADYWQGAAQLTGTDPDNPAPSLPDVLQGVPAAVTQATESLYDLYIAPTVDFAAENVIKPISPLLIGAAALAAVVLLKR